MEQWIGSVHSKMAWRTHKFGVYRVLEKSSSYIYVCIYINLDILFKLDFFMYYNLFYIFVYTVNLDI